MRKNVIGIFDSGVGGLSAVREIRKHISNISIIYFADTINFPYGTKTKEEIKQYAKSAVDFFLTKNVNTILVACGTVSSIALDDMQEMTDIPVYGIINDTIKSACKTTKTKHIGIIGTQVTIDAGKIEEKIKDNNPDAFILRQPCPLFVSLVERGIVDKGNEALQKACKMYLSDFRGKIDALVLGCTHFSHIREIIEDFLPGIKIIDPVEKMVEKIAEDMRSNNLLSDSFSQGSAKFFVSGGVERFAEVGKRLLGIAEMDVRGIKEERRKK